MVISSRSLLYAFSFCLIQAASAEGPTNWPVPTPPPNTNSATFAAPRNEWMENFTRNLQLAKGGKIDLLFEGDSITAGWRVTGREVFSARYGSLNAVSFGIGGDRTESVLWRIQQGELNGIEPKLIVLMIGTNNHANTPAQVAEGVGAVVKEMRTHCPKSHILLLAIFPRSQKPTDSLRLKVEEVNKLIAPLADGKNVTFLDFGKKFLAPDGTLPAELMPDFLHPNAKGYEIWADAIQDVVNQYVKGS